MAPTDTIVKTTCPRDCYDACGALVVVRDGAVHAVRGDPDHHMSRGKLCRKCTLGYNGAFLDPAARLTTPLIRTGPKGTGAYREATWDEATALIAQRFTAIVDDPLAGPTTILNTHYTGTFGVLGYGYGLRFVNRLGATEVDPDSVCNLAGHLALGYLWGEGSSEAGFDPRTLADSQCLLIWGANPSVSAPHADEHWVSSAPGTVIVVDPLLTDTARRADLHLQPFPGSDAALAFALLHVIASEGLTDDAFLAEHATGWDELLPTISGCTPAWGEATTGVPAELIQQAARIYAAGPSLLWLGQGMQRQPVGGNAMRSAALLPAATGNVGKPGTGFLYLNGTAIRGVDYDLVTGEALAAAPRPSISQMDLAARLEDPTTSRALLCWNINVAASNPQQRRLRAAMAREDLFTVAIDLFPTDTTDLADVILPAASFLEYDDVVMSYFDVTVSAQPAAAPPLGDALPNTEIFRRLAAAMGYTEPELFESDRAVLERVLQETVIGLTFDELAQVGTVPYGDTPRPQFADLTFATPSGKVEIASTAAEAGGVPRLPFPHADPRPDGGRLRLLSPASRWALNHTFTNDPKITAQSGTPEVALHPADAAERGIATGDLVVLENATGEIALQAAITDTVPRGVAMSPKGRWPRRESTGANINVLNPGAKSDMGEATAVHGVEVTV
ncbi:MAG: molybdopterin-dependent oxidoreductase, partial [Solirubrobacteraceae bacterium]|nr:molybdopterin-dependent oxidoreductase [Solirubrobacteraceae bacterium]